MANSFVTINEGTGEVTKRLDSEQLTVGATLVERERVVLAGAGSTNYVDVDTNGAVFTRVKELETRFDYDTRTDGNPVYVGKNANGTATSASTWTVQKFTYDSSNRCTRIQVLTGIWDNRATLAW